MDLKIPLKKKKIYYEKCQHDRTNGLGVSEKTEFIQEINKETTVQEDRDFLTVDRVTYHVPSVHPPVLTNNGGKENEFVGVWPTGDSLLDQLPGVLSVSRDDNLSRGDPEGRRKLHLS